MICRIWHGWTTRENADAYERLLRTEIFRASPNAAPRLPGHRPAPAASGAEVDSSP